MKRAQLAAGPSRATLLVTGLVGLALTFSACSGDDETEPAAEQAAPAAQAETSGGSQGESGSTGNAGSQDDAGGGDRAAGAATGTSITTGDSQFGQVLYDGDQRAIYYFDKEQTSESECYGDCAAAWPPVLSDGEPSADGGAQGRLIDTTERRDGSLQVTYDGRPLYYYVDDPPGVVLCHNVAEFGGLWLAVEPDGAPVQ